MQIETARCHGRGCKHWQGFKALGEEENAETVNYCPAFPNGIPYEIAFGKNKHTTPHVDQKNDIVFEKETV